MQDSKPLAMKSSSSSRVGQSPPRFLRLTSRPTAGTAGGVQPVSPRASQQASRKTTQSSAKEVLAEFRQKTRRSLPSDQRWEVWKLALGPGQVQQETPSGFALYNQPTYAELCAGAMAPGASPESDDGTRQIRQIELDLDRTSLKLNTEERETLDRILKTFAFARQTQVRCDQDLPEYVQGMSHVVALLLRVSECKEEETFHMFVQLMCDYRFCKFYEEGLPLSCKWGREHTEYMRVKLPDVFDKCAEEGMPAELLTQNYCAKWFMGLFVAALPLPLVISIVDVAICNLDSIGQEPTALREVSISLLDLMSPALLSPNMDSLGLQNALCGTSDTDNFVEHLEHCLETKSHQHWLETKSHLPWMSWQVLACGFAGFVAGSAMKNDEREKREKEFREKSDELSLKCEVLQSQRNCAAGIAVGAFGTLVLVGMACHAEPMSSLALLDFLSTNSHTVHAAAMPVTFLGLCWFDTVGQRVAEPFIELGQDMLEGIDSLFNDSLKYFRMLPC